MNTFRTTLVHSVNCNEGCSDPLYANFMNVSKSLLCVQRGFWSLIVCINNFFGTTKFEHPERQEDVVYSIQISSNKLISAIKMYAGCT